MDGQEPIDDLDWDAIDKQVELYDLGDRSPPVVDAKRLDIAFQHGYEQCIMDQAEVANQFAIMMTHPAGNA